MTEYKFTNNAESTLDGAIGGGDVTLNVESGEGSLFPAAGSGDVFYVLVNASAFMLCTSRTGDALTVTRTESGSFADGATVKLVINSTILETFLQKGVFRTNAGDPDGSLVAEYTGEEVYDSTNDVWYKHCTGTTWKLMNGSA